MLPYTDKKEYVFKELVEKFFDPVYEEPEHSDEWKDKDSFYCGTKFCFKVPDSFNHENEVRNFMVIGGETNSLQTKLSIIYCDNECKCKDGWVKFTNWFDYKHFKKEDLVNFLKEYYGDKFDEKSLIMGSRLTY